MATIARAIDIGYGNTKFTLGDGRDGSSDIECKMIPSVAPLLHEGEIAKFVDNNNLVVIEVGGQRYQIGPDAMLGMGSNASRALDLDFAKKDSYLALARGAMHLMNVPRIDHLCVGLPVSSMDALSQHVKDLLAGDHPLPGGVLHVGQVSVVPQPVGGMYDYGVRHEMMSELRSGNSLLIDPGYFTLDWVVTNGTKMVGVRSGAANNAGMAAILSSIAEKLAARSKERFSEPAHITEGVLDRIDESLRLGTEFRFKGQVENLQDYMGGSQNVVGDALNKLRTRVGTLDDIDRVIIVGGASHLYEKAVCAMFPRYEVRVAKQAVFANVRGFQLMANAAARASNTYNKIAAAV
jgi:plasmid segregation protein ParM